MRPLRNPRSGLDGVDGSPSTDTALQHCEFGGRSAASWAAKLEDAINNVTIDRAKRFIGQSPQAGSYFRTIVRRPSPSGGAHTCATWDTHEGFGNGYRIPSIYKEDSQIKGYAESF